MEEKETEEYTKEVYEIIHASDREYDTMMQAILGGVSVMPTYGKIYNLDEKEEVVDEDDLEKEEKEEASPVATKRNTLIGGSTDSRRRKALLNLKKLAKK